MPLAKQLRKIAELHPETRRHLFAKSLPQHLNANLPPNAFNVGCDILVWFPEYTEAPKDLQESLRATFSYIERTLQKFLWVAQNALPIVVRTNCNQKVRLDEKLTFIEFDETFLRDHEQKTEDVVKLAYIGEMLRLFLKTECGDTLDLNSMLNNTVNLRQVFEGNFEGVNQRGGAFNLYKTLMRDNRKVNLGSLDLDELILLYPHTKLSDVDDMFFKFQLDVVFGQSSLRETLTTDHLRKLIDMGHPYSLDVHVVPSGVVGSGLRPSEDLFCENVAVYLHYGPHAVKPAIKLWIEDMISYVFEWFYYPSAQGRYESSQNLRLKSKIFTRKTARADYDDDETSYERKHLAIDKLVRLYRFLKGKGHPAEQMVLLGVTEEDGGQLVWPDHSFIRLEITEDSKMTLRAMLNFAPELTAKINRTPMGLPEPSMREAIHEVLGELFYWDL